MTPELKKTREFRMWKAMKSVTDGVQERIFLKYMQEGTDLSVKQSLVIRKVYELTEEVPEGIPLKDLAAALKLTPGTVSELVDNLVRKKVLLRVQNPNDRRAVLITIAQQSMEIIHDAIRKTCSIVENLWQLFEDREKDMLIDLLEKLEAKLAIEPENEKA